MTTLVPLRRGSSPEADAIMNRLEGQTEWYDRKSLENQKTFKRIKVIEIVAAALVPFLAVQDFKGAPVLTAALGVLVRSWKDCST